MSSLMEKTPVIESLLKKELSRIHNLFIFFKKSHNNNFSEVLRRDPLKSSSQTRIKKEKEKEKVHRLYEPIFPLRTANSPHLLRERRNGMARAHTGRRQFQDYGLVFLFVFFS